MKKLLLTLFFTSSILAYANNENFDNYFIDGNGDDINNWGLDPNSYIIPDPYFPSEYFENKELENSSWKNSYLSNISFENSNLTNADFENAVFHFVIIPRNIDGANFEDTYFLAGNLGGLTLEQFKQTKNYKQKDLSGLHFINMNLKNCNLMGFTSPLATVNCDLRGSISSNIFLNASHCVNTIDHIGFIRGFDRSSSTGANPFSIARYDGISAKLDQTSSISDGAVLKLESGAILDVLNNSTLSLINQGTIIFDVSENFSSVINIEKNSEFILEDGGKIVINLTDEFVLNDKEINVMTWDDGSTINGFDKLVKGENIVLNQNGVEFDDFWTFEVRSDGLYISVPEPATYAAIFGAIVLAFTAYRRRK